MGINEKGKSKHLINISTTSNTYHATGQYPVVELGLFIPSPSVKTLALLQTQSPNRQASDVQYSSGMATLSSKMAPKF